MPIWCWENFTTRGITSKAPNRFRIIRGEKSKTCNTPAKSISSSKKQQWPGVESRGIISVITLLSGRRKKSHHVKSYSSIWVTYYPGVSLANPSTGSNGLPGPTPNWIQGYIILVKFFHLVNHLLLTGAAELKGRPVHQHGVLRQLQTPVHFWGFLALSRGRLWGPPVFTSLLQSVSRIVDSLCRCSFLLLWNIALLQSRHEQLAKLPCSKGPLLCMLAHVSDLCQLRQGSLHQGWHMALVFFLRVGQVSLITAVRHMTFGE